MTFADLLFQKPFTPPLGTMVTRVHLTDGYAEPEKYRPSPDLQHKLNKRMRKVTESEQKILDYILKHPACTREQIAIDLKMSMNRMGDRLMALVSRGSVVREGRCLSRRGGPKTYFYWIAKRGGTQ